MATRRQELLKNLHKTKLPKRQRLKWGVYIFLAFLWAFVWTALGLALLLTEIGAILGLISLIIGAGMLAHVLKRHNTARTRFAVVNYFQECSKIQVSGKPTIRRIK